MIKPVLIVAPDGYIFHIQGPYFSDYYNNDAALLQAEFERHGEMMRRWFQENDIVLIDRGYQDSAQLLDHLGIVYKMPSLLQWGMRQLSTKDTNDSRIITKSRCLFEARNGHIKTILRFPQQTILIQHVPNIGDFYRIAGAN